MFADKLRELRKAKGLTQPEFAKAFNVAFGTVSMWETGKRQPDFQTLTRLAEFFGVTTDYLLDRENKKSSAATELKDVYFNFAKRAQDNGLDPEDIEMILTLVERMKKKKSDDQKGTL